MYMNRKLCTVFVHQNVLAFLENHGRPAVSCCLHREYVLRVRGNVQRPSQHCFEVVSSAVHQEDLCITSALCHSLAPCAVSQLYAMCPGLELVIKPPELGDVCDDMRGCPAVDHQASQADTLAAWLESCSPIGHQEYVLVCHFLGGPPCCVLAPSPFAGHVSVRVAFAVAAPQFALASAGNVSLQAAPIAHYVRCSPFSYTFSWACTVGSRSPLSRPHRHYIVLSGWGTHLFNVIVTSKLCFEFGKPHCLIRLRYMDGKRFK